ncbi:Hypp7170 [Branchiostoma lanceolatum]|uniref:Hypp7170 protein n=1 Tax=Branchiostoma lanceolatum TaxID=7740 RepID=A0A8J9YY10_BRALA|nr:Hypp7170 [Branchiostoma lanceolatum]
MFVVKDKPMSEHHRNVIRKKYVPLSRDLEARYVMPHLYQEDVLMQEMMEDLDAIPDERCSYKARKLLDLIMTRGDRAFGVFKQALEESGYKHLAELLKEKKLSETSIARENANIKRSSSAVASDDVPPGPLRLWRLSLHPFKNSPTARTFIKGFRLMESGGEILVNSSYADVSGVDKVVEGFILQERLTPSSHNHFLYSGEGLGLEKGKMEQLMGDFPDSSSCLFLQAALMPFDDGRSRALRKALEFILRRGKEDPLYESLHHIYSVLGDTILNLNRDNPVAAVPVFTSALMYKPDCFLAIHLAAECSMVLSPPDAAQQFQRYLQLAPPCDKRVHWAHYCLAILYSWKSETDEAEEHYKFAVEAEENILPNFVTGWAKREAQRAFHLDGKEEETKPKKVHDVEGKEEETKPMKVVDTNYTEEETKPMEIVDASKKDEETKPMKCL